MSFFYRIAYLVGFTPWEDAAKSQHDLAAAVLEREEAGRQPGRALDIGCGSGLWSVELARRGWDVTGVDNAPGALKKARKRRIEPGQHVKWVLGDVTNMHAEGIQGPFEFFLDLGCFHGLHEEKRAAMAEEIGALAAPGATLLELVWAPGNRGPLPSGASLENLQKHFSEWKIIEIDSLDSSALPGFLKRVSPRLVRMLYSKSNQD